MKQRFSVAVVLLATVIAGYFYFFRAFVPEPVRAEKIKLFLDLLAEYRAEEAKSQEGRSKQASEIAQYRAMLAFYEMRDAYWNLNSTEKRSIFGKGLNLPRGIKLDGGPAVTEIIGISLISKDARKDFEDFLDLSYAETDYMSTWYINNGLMDEIKDAYYRDLEKRGLRVVDRK